MSSGPKKKGMAIGVALAAIGGVITGILFAPKSGKETRQDIKNAASKAAERFNVEGKKLHSEISDLIKKVETKVTGASDSVKDKSSDLLNKAKHAKDSLKTLALSVKAGEADDKDLDKAISKAKEARDSLKAYLKK